MMLEALEVSARAIRLPGQLEGLDGLIIPGGESTAIAKLMVTYDFYEPIRRHAAAGLAVWGTCAGAILLARNVLDAVPGQKGLGLMDMTVRRNAFGRQVDSFEADLDFSGLEGDDFRGVFIRAPWIEELGEDAQELACHDGHIVAARQGRLLASVFHPELTGDPRVHRYFMEHVVGA
ncbi:MAG: pyridoxal 5'-phosphate synthase glutaminase subunit PdxT [Actinobacteria bacterium HGW-Actinobacteria-9]|nr:MAG: pyridoxal 5'-phosphate synthase glutaminase subunit PdxT [Actinobacteria bacterium HGW-Actinobacteria-9]